MKSEETLYDVVARAFSDLDAESLIAVLDGQCIYESQSVFEPLVGKDQIAAYLARKFDAIRKGDPSKRLKAEAVGELGALKKGAVLVRQGPKQFYVMLECTGDGLISRVDLMIIPPPWFIRRPRCPPH